MASNPILDPSLNDILEHLINSTCDVFSKMCGIDVAICGEPIPGRASNRYEMSGVIGFTGALQATVAINLPRLFAFRIFECLTGTYPETMEDDVIDTVGELANMIAGKTKECMGDNGLALGLPTVILGQKHHVLFGANMKISVLRFSGIEGPLQIEIGINAPPCVQCDRHD